MIMIVVRSIKREQAKFCRDRRVRASRAEKGSSIKTRGQSSIKVRARAIRCRIPPERV